VIGPSVRTDFLESLGFGLDAFQIEALDALDRGSSVLVSAPTGAGKTLVAAYGVHRARAADRKAFYTTPLKALSNQKFAELCAEHGDGQVGLLTGDASVRPGAPIVVMTTEVLRNMLLTGSPQLRDLGAVVLDEVHFLQDPYRGGVWEEVLILTPPDVTFICLSATVANARVLGEWLSSVRGALEVVVERQRPIDLHHRVALERRNDPEPVLVDLLDGRGLSAEGRKIDSLLRSSRGHRTNAAGSSWQGRYHAAQSPIRSPRRTEVIELLESKDLLPCIYFIFSRAGCEDAVRQCVREGVRLLDRASRRRTRAIAESCTEDLGDEDLEALGWHEWLEALESGVAAHHAGLVPSMKLAVEQCFLEGLLGAVFATETLALGVNMPARAVVIERFSKFGGAGRATLTSGEYAQLTGRAGRRGLDDEGHAVIVFSQETDFADMSRVALAPPPDLHSTFRPTYNLTANLVARFDRATAHELLSRSYAQFESDRRAGPARRPLTEALARRLAVLEELGYVDGWSLTERGSVLRGVYHESDLLVAEALNAGMFDDLEPPLVGAVLSGFVFEPRRARRAGHGPRAAATRPRTVRDRLGQKRRETLDARGKELALIATRLLGLEHIHLVPHTRLPESQAAASVAAWARGAPLGDALAVVARDAGEVAPGDFVRVVRQVADLCEQVGRLARSEATRAAAEEAATLLVRSVVAHVPASVTVSGRVGL
jgi:ATP-dependent RNA helicase HelY